MKQMLVYTVCTLSFLYLLLCVLLFLFQEKLIFFPQKLSKNFSFHFNQSFKEINFKTEDGLLLHILLFKAENAKGVIFYLHGNAGSLASWGEVASIYTHLQYDVFMLDYRGYGKSEGRIKSQEQFYKDVQTAYNTVKSLYNEERIIVLGYSIGTSAAAYIAAANHPKLLLLQAPFFSLTSVMKYHYPYLPTFLLKYKFKTFQFVKACKMPVIVFHGNRDEIIPYQSSLELQKLFKPADRLITLEGQDHNGISSHPAYITALKKILIK